MTSGFARRTALAGVLLDDGPVGRLLAWIVLAAAWVSTWRPQVDPDAWWHLAVGESVLAGRIPTVEPFSWLTADGPFMAHSWAWDALLAGTYRLGGPAATSVLGAGLELVIVGLLWVLLGQVAGGVAPLVRALGVLAAVLATFPIWVPRAGLVDVAGVLGVAVVVEAFLRGGTRRPLVTLPILAIAWANLHGSGILALPIGLAVGLVAAPLGWRTSAWPRRPLRPLLLWSVVAVAAAALNPSGPALLAYPFDPAVASAGSAVIAEWNPPDFSEAGLVLLRLLIAGAIVGAVLVPPTRRDPHALLLAAGWTVAALGAVRFAPLAAPFLVVALMPALERSLPGRPAPAPLTAGARRALTAITAVVVLLMGAAGWTTIEPARQDGAIARRFPVAAATALHGVDCGARLLVAYDWAGYVAWRTGRLVGAYGSSPGWAVEEQARVEALGLDPRPFLDEHAVDAALVPIGIPLERWLAEADEWTAGRRDDQAALYVRGGTACAIS